MFIVHGGLPRSGTVLVGTIIRALLFRRGHGFTRLAPQERRDLPRYADLIRTRAATPATLSHTHLIDRACIAALAGREDATVFWNYREPRDVLISLMRLHALDFDHALRSVEIFLRSEREVANAGLGIRLRYEDLVADPTRHVLLIAGAAGLDVGPEDAEQIAAETAPEQHRAVMLGLRDGVVPNQRTLPTLHGPLREDPDTLINEHHIQSGAAGRWRNELTPEQQDRATRHLGRWIEVLGYAL